MFHKSCFSLLDLFDATLNLTHNIKHLTFMFNHSQQVENVSLIR